MTREEAIKVLSDIDKAWRNFSQEEYVALEMAIKALEHPEQNVIAVVPCWDAISRKQAVEAFQMFREYESNRSNKGWVNRIETVLNQLPSVTPKPKTGHWIKIKPYPLQMHDYECSECCHETDDNTENYCSECGAKMVKVQERSEG